MSLPVFSIVTPSFRQLDLLAACVASVAAQAEPELPVEHIVQDAGTPGIENFAAQLGATFYRNGQMILLAPDGSGYQADKRKSYYSLRVYSETDLGMYDAINKGLLKANGKFCAWLNCDEQYIQGAFSSVAHLFANNPQVDATFGDMVVVDRSDKPLCYRRGVVQDTRLLSFSALNISSCTLFFRRTIVERQLLLDVSYRIVGDKEWMIRLLGAGIRFQPLWRPVACFHLLPDSLTMSESAMLEENRLANAMGKPPLVQRLALKLAQTIRKFLAGCYWPRYVDFELLQVSGQFVRIGPKWLGFRWPNLV